MKQLTLLIVVPIALMTLSVQPLPAQTFVTGEASRAYFKFAVPPPQDWNGDLVIWNDGFSLTPAAPFTVDPDVPLAGLGPLAAVQFSEGFAIATSSRRQIGWAVFKSNKDLDRLMSAFVKRFGSPKRIFLAGASLGSLVAIQAIETANLGNVVGGLSLCGPLAGSRNWDIALDLRLTYDAVCSEVAGAGIPGGAEGLPEGSTLTMQAVAGAVNQCTGNLMPPSLRTGDQQARLAKILSVTGLPENFLLTDMIFATFGMSDLVHDPQKLRGRVGVSNESVNYGEPDINNSIERVLSSPRPRRRLEKNYTPTGAVGATRIVSLHTDKDGLVMVENESSYYLRTPAANFTKAIAVEATPSHCGFTPAEMVAGWESLRGWVDGRSPQPTAAGIQATCQQVTASVGGACRIDPAFVLPEVDGRLRPR